MLLIPWRSDAPQHYPPHMTAIIVAICSLLSVLQLSGFISDQNFNAYFILHYGSDFNPLQILTSMFAHADLSHLLGNMLFLWVFGIIVEGKIGKWAFLAFYMGCGLGCGIIEMLIFSGAGSGSLGASSAIYGLTAAALLWAPKNRLDCVFFFFPIIRTFNLSIAFITIYFIGSDLVFSLFLGLRPSTPMLHAIGAFCGFAGAYYMLHFNKVNCEGWDAITLMKNGKPDYSKKWNSVPKENSIKREQRDYDMSYQLFLDYLKEGYPSHASLVYESALNNYPGGLKLSKEEYWTHLNSLLKQRLYKEAKKYAYAFHQRFPKESCGILALASIAVRYDKNGHDAITYLKKLNGRALNFANKQKAEILLRDAQELNQRDQEPSLLVT